MNDKGLDSGLIREFDTNKRELRGQSRGFFGFRKMFTDYLTKLNVPFVDNCCLDLTGNIFPVRWNGDTLERFDGIDWVEVPDPDLSGFEEIANKNTSNGYAGLDSNIYLDIDQYNPLTRHIRKDYLEETPLLTELVAGATFDAIVPNTRVGALSTATIAKFGNFDNFVITDGTNTSLIHYPQLRVSDNRAILKAKIKINAYRTNGALDCILGIGYFGQQAPNDTGTVEQFAIYFNLTQKTVFYRNSSSSTFVDVTSSFKVSANTIVTSGDIFEITVQRSPEIGGFVATLQNTYNGEYITGIFTNLGLSSRALGIQNSHLRLTATNGTFTILDFKAYSSTPKVPLLYTMGDSYACGDTNASSTVFPSLLINDTSIPYYIVCGAGNGAYINAMAQFQLPEVIKLQPRYVLLMSILSVFYGHFDDGGANQTTFDNSFNNIMKGITSYGGIPILVKWQTTGGFINGNSAAWDTYVNAALITYPTTLVLDLSAEALLFNDSSHPGTADHIKIKNKLVTLLQSEGAIHI